MKFKVCLKDPDGFCESVKEAADRYVAQNFSSADDDEKEVMIEAREDKINDFLSKWVEYGEYITIEFDTEAGTATVVENK